ncbi:GNAT family N-acetyltransferase [Sphingomonas sp. ABOLH]|uniref:GNAT family N-acetyltransferase n=1 Tax=Sphingomonas sp. ABOLH TaxID=1985881 RepID=UPI000F7EDC3B|nr:GNAT family N-acetyltransferase [Sphingomonas sp. ABOLH]RSV17004.1 N-acetyltransferase [Sphingomonas sp. ABOLH]RSV29424.1 N-acetyltransferase [Sphingomonas sp. ABOLH]
MIRPDPAVCATAGAACGRKSLSSARIQAIFTSNDTPLGECRLIHTEVPFQYSGQGLGSQLARGVFDTVRARGGKIVLRCSFMGRFFARHPEYSDIVSG